MEAAAAEVRPAELREAHRLTGHADRVWALAWNPAPGPGAGPMLASCGGDKTVRIWKRAPDGAWSCTVTRQSPCFYSV
jgi:cytosolic iron-sulfur protein assembly protein CIAO1